LMQHVRLVRLQAWDGDASHWRWPRARP
jgi:hypothetical protein